MTVFVHIIRREKSHRVVELKSRNRSPIDLCHFANANIVGILIVHVVYTKPPFSSWGRGFFKKTPSPIKLCNYLNCLFPLLTAIVNLSLFELCIIWLQIVFSPWLLTPSRLRIA